MKLKGLLSLLLLPTLIGCASLRKDAAASSVNQSDLYDPSKVTLKAGVIYPFVEGNLTGRGKGHTLHSHAAFTRALIIGNER